MHISDEGDGEGHGERNCRECRQSRAAAAKLQRCCAWRSGASGDRVTWRSRRTELLLPAFRKTENYPGQGQEKLKT